MAAPAAVEEGGLVDDVGAGPHGGEGLGLGGGERGDGVAGHGELDDGLAFGDSRSTCLVSCSPPRRERTSSMGSSRLGRSRSPRAADSSSWVRCSHAAKPVRSLGLSANVPSSRRCMAALPARDPGTSSSLALIPGAPFRSRPGRGSRTRGHSRCSGAGAGRPRSCDRPARARVGFGDQAVGDRQCVAGAAVRAALGGRCGALRRRVAHRSRRQDDIGDRLQVRAGEAMQLPRATVGPATTSTGDRGRQRRGRGRRRCRRRSRPRGGRSAW